MGESRGLSRRSPPPPSLPEAHTPSQRSAAHTQARWSLGQGTTPQAASGDRCRRKRQLWRTLSRPVQDANDLSSRYTLAELNSRQRLGTFLRVPGASRPPSPLVLTKSLSGGGSPGPSHPPSPLVLTKSLSGGRAQMPQTREGTCGTGPCRRSTVQPAPLPRWCPRGPGAEGSAVHLPESPAQP